MCGEESADHVVLNVQAGGKAVRIVLDDLIKTPDGWKVIDAGISCQ